MNPETGKLTYGDTVIFEVTGRRGSGVKEGVIRHKVYSWRKMMWEYSIHCTDVRTGKEERWTVFRPRDKEDEGIKFSARTSKDILVAKAEQFDDRQEQVERELVDAYLAYSPAIQEALKSGKLLTAFMKGEVYAMIRYRDIGLQKRRLDKISPSGVYPIENGRVRRRAVKWISVVDLIVSGKSCRPEAQ